MTWRKTGTEFDDECANVGLSDAAYRTHLEGIGFVYKIENVECRFAKTALRRFATSEHTSEAIRELLDHGFWGEHANHYEIRHHADVIRDSLAAQQNKRDRDRKAQQNRRAKQDKDSAERDVSGDVSADTRQTDRQTDKHLGERVPTTCEHQFHPDRQIDPWSSVAACEQCQEKAGRLSA